MGHHMMGSRSWRIDGGVLVEDERECVDGGKGDGHD